MSLWDRLRKEFGQQLDIAEAQHHADIVLMMTDGSAQSELRNLHQRLTWNQWGQLVAELQLIASGPDIFRRQLPRAHKATRLAAYTEKL